MYSSPSRRTVLPNSPVFGSWTLSGLGRGARFDLLRILTTSLEQNVTQFCVFVSFSDPDSGGSGEGGKLHKATWRCIVLRCSLPTFVAHFSFNFLKIPYLDLPRIQPELDNTVFHFQLLPKRIDWTGKEHPGSYENLVRHAL